MASDFVEARPGDIISSAMINELLQRLAVVEEQIEQLAGSVGQPSDPVAITSLVPEDEVMVGQELTLVGRGFRFPPVELGLPTNTVRITNAQLNIQVNNFLFDSSTTRLSFLVPPISITAATNVTIQVSNSAGEAQPRQYRLLPATAPTAPQPIIAGVFPLNAPHLTNIIFTAASANRVAVIQGANFAAQASDNVVQFVLPGTNMTVPGPGEPQLQLAVTSPTEIHVTVPPIPQVPPFGTIPLLLSVHVTGNNTPATRAINARRG